MKITKSDISISCIFLLLLLTGCSKLERHKGIVGNYYSITVQAPWGVEDPAFKWGIVKIPERSQLSFSELIMRNNGEEMTFQPDETGNYEFELIIYDSEGEQVTSQTYMFMVEAAPPVFEKVEEEVSEEAVISESLPDSPLTTELEAKEFIPDVTEPQPIEVVYVDTESFMQEVSEESFEIAADLIKFEAEFPVSDKFQEVTKPVKTPRDSKILKVEGKFTIQISSLPTFQEAQEEAEKLLALGFDAYIQKAYFEKSGEVWYRVRVGSFSEHDVASQAASEISSAINKNTWVDHVREDFNEN